MAQEQKSLWYGMVFLIIKYQPTAHASDLTSDKFWIFSADVKNSVLPRLRSPAIKNEETQRKWTAAWWKQSKILQLTNNDVTFVLSDNQPKESDCAL